VRLAELFLLAQRIEPGRSQMPPNSSFPSSSPAGKTPNSGAASLLLLHRGHVEHAGEISHLVDILFPFLASYFSSSPLWPTPLSADVRRRRTSGAPRRQHHLHLIRAGETRPTRPASLPGAPCSARTRAARRWSPPLPSPGPASPPRQTACGRARTLRHAGSHVTIRPHPSSPQAS
jgi:hypothetical protein